MKNTLHGINGRLYTAEKKEHENTTETIQNGIQKSKILKKINIENISKLWDHLK